jgi:hypothetical protein
MKTIAPPIAAALVFGAIAFELPCRAQSMQPDAPDPALPFYDAGGATLQKPPPPPANHPFLVMPSVNATELAMPSIASYAALIEPMVEVGNDIWAIGIGYSNLAREHGFVADASIGARSSAIRMFDAGGWRGSWLMPDIHAHFSYYPGQTRLPAFLFGFTTRAGGVMIAKNFGKTSFEMSTSAIFGPMIVKIDAVRAGVIVGAHLDMGVGF